MISIFKKRPKIDEEPEPMSLLTAFYSTNRRQTEEMVSALRDIRSIMVEQGAIQAQVMTKMAKFFEAQVKWTEKQIEDTDRLKPTSDDLKF
jgi:hypothetical protein